MIRLSQNYIGNPVPLETFNTWLVSYVPLAEDQAMMEINFMQWQEFINPYKPDFIISITKGPHNGTWYPPGITYYFDFQLLFSDGLKSREYHALLQNNYVVGIR